MSQKDRMGGKIRRLRKEEHGAPAGRGFQTHQRKQKRKNIRTARKNKLEMRNTRRLYGTWAPGDQKSPSRDTSWFGIPSESGRDRKEQGTARQGKARKGKTTQGEARRGKARQGTVRRRDKSQQVMGQKKRAYRNGNVTTIQATGQDRMKSKKPKQTRPTQKQ